MSLGGRVSAFFLATASAVRFFAAAWEALVAIARRSSAVSLLARAFAPILASCSLYFLGIFMAGVWQKSTLQAR